MGKKTPERGRPFIGKQVNIRIPPTLLSDLEYIAEATGNDLSSIIRLVLSEQLSPYLQRSRDSLRLREEARTCGEG